MKLDFSRTKGNFLPLIVDSVPLNVNKKQPQEEKDVFKAPFYPTLIIGLALLTFFYSGWQLYEFSQVQGYPLQHYGNIDNFYYIFYFLLGTFSIWWSLTLPGKDEQLPFNLFCKATTALPFALCVFANTFGCVGAAYYGMIFKKLAVDEEETNYYFWYFNSFIIYNLLIVMAQGALTYYMSHYYISTYRPFENKDSYVLTKSVSKNCGVEILSSTPYQIILTNSTDKEIFGPNIEIRRKVRIGFKVTRTDIPFPNIRLAPGHTVMLIPYTLNEPAGAAKVFAYRCFGYAVGDSIQTVMVDPKKKELYGTLEESYEKADNRFRCWRLESGST